MRKHVEESGATGAGVALAGSVSGCGAGGPKEPRTGCSGRRVLVLAIS